MCFFSKFKNVLGTPGQGIHKYRFFKYRCYRLFWNFNRCFYYNICNQITTCFINNWCFFIRYNISFIIRC